jgi:hypothetical protein
MRSAACTCEMLAAANIMRPSSLTYHNRSSGDVKLHYDSQVLLVERIIETKEQGLVLFGGSQRLPPSAWRPHAWRRLLRWKAALAPS